MNRGTLTVRDRGVETLLSRNPHINAENRADTRRWTVSFIAAVNAFHARDIRSKKNEL